MAKYNFIDATPKLARIMAGEKLDVLHGNYSTASFDPQNRVLRLPIWEDADKDVYNLLVVHEVGHAIYTPKTWSHEAQKEIPGCPKSILNIVEDIRIEKLIRRQYPGTYGMFVRAYQKMLNADRFGIKGIDPNTLGFLNKLNIYAKCGNLVPLNFDEDEKNLVDIAMQIETWDDTLRVTKILSKFVDDRDKKREGSEASDQDQDGQSDGDDADQEQDGQSGGDDADQDQDQEQDGQSGGDDSQTAPDHMQKDSDVSTDTTMRHTEEDMSISDDTRVLRVSRQSAYNVIKSSHSLMASDRHPYRRFQKSNKAFVQRMVNEFNVRQHARKQKKIEIAKSGRIDPVKLPMYNISDDIFVRYGIDPHSQNHAVCMYVDCSGSMTSVDRLPFVAREVAIMAEFCRTLKIPFQVYGWTSPCIFSLRPSYTGQSVYFNNIDQNAMQLWVDSTMSPAKYKSAIGALQEMVEGKRAIQTGGTPLVEAKAAAAILSAEYKKAHNADKLHVIFLTDGVGSSNLNKIDGSSNSYTHKTFSVQFEGQRSYIKRYGSTVTDERCIDDHIRSMCDNYILIDVGDTESFIGYYYSELYDQQSNTYSYDSVIPISPSLRNWAVSFSGGKHVQGDTSGAVVRERNSNQYRDFRKISGIIGKMVA